jgi:predicted anti-sigma-YlaC factor YlaD
MSSREPVHPEELLLLDYVIGQLPDETRDQIKRHVAGCRACRRTIDDLILTVDELDRLPTMAIPHDSPAELAAARARPRSRIRFFVPALALVLFALLALVTLGGSRGGATKQPQMQTFALDVRTGDVKLVQQLLPEESAQFVFESPDGYAILAPKALIPSIVAQLRRVAPGTTNVHVVSTGSADIRNALAS